MANLSICHGKSAERLTSGPDHFRHVTSERLLGAAVVQARSQEIAVMALARFGCDPGGEARCMQIPAELGTPPKLYRERLLGLDEARKLADLLETWGHGRQVSWLNV
jgi:hypothetical protein